MGNTFEKFTNADSSESTVSTVDQPTNKQEQKVKVKINYSQFDDYTKTLTVEQAVAEASKCLACGCGAGCEICRDICKMFAYDMNPDGKISFDEDKCVACGMCIYRCPNKNIEMIQTGTENLV